MTRHDILKNTEPHLKHCQAPTLIVPDVPEIRAYLAGLIDGEGSIYQRSGSGTIRNPGGDWHIVVAMTNLEVIQWCAKFGGKMYTRPARENRLQAWEWKVSRRADVLALIDAVYDYLIVKADKAEEAYADILGRLS